MNNRYNTCQGDDALCTSGGTIAEADCRVVDTWEDYTVPAEDLFIACTLEGLLCYGSNQTDSTCEDYEVKYFCDCELILILIFGFSILSQF